MPDVQVSWRGGWRFMGRDSKGVHVAIDGEQSEGAKPSDLLPLALAACSATDVVQVLDEGDAELADLTVSARYLQEPSAPWSFQNVKLHYELVGTGLDEDSVAEAIRRSEEEMCSVAASLAGAVEIQSTFEITAG